MSNCRGVSFPLVLLLVTKMPRFSRRTKPAKQQNEALRVKKKRDCSLRVEIDSLPNCQKPLCRFDPFWQTARARSQCEKMSKSVTKLSVVSEELGRSPYRPRPELGAAVKMKIPGTCTSRMVPEIATGYECFIQTYAG